MAVFEQDKLPADVRDRLVPGQPFRLVVTATELTWDLIELPPLTPEDEARIEQQAKEIYAALSQRGFRNA